MKKTQQESNGFGSLSKAGASAMGFDKSAAGPETNKFN